MFIWYTSNYMSSTSTAQTISPRRVPAQERARKKYDAILTAAITVLDQNGYSGTSISKIAEEANVPTSTLYDYFQDKDAIYIAILETHANAIMAHIKELAKAQPRTSPRQALYFLIRAGLEFPLAGGDALRLVFEELPQSLWGPSFETLQSEVLGLVPYVEWINIKFTQRDDFQLRLHVITDCIFGFIIRQITSKNQQLSTNQLAEELVTLIAGYIGIE